MMTLHLGDCLDVLRALPADSVDAVVTDPPAGIAFMGKEWDAFGARGKNNSEELRAAAYDCYGKGASPYGFSGPTVSQTGKNRAGFIAFLTPVLAECLRVARPGAVALVWALPRTSHWTGTAIEDAGWVIEDRIAHLFGTGFPKHKSKLKPACEDWWLCRKPGPKWLGVEECRIATDEKSYFATNAEPGGHRGNSLNLIGYDALVKRGGGHAAGRWPANVTLDEYYEPILRLKNTCDSSTIRVITEYFHDYPLSRLHPRVRDLSLPTEEGQSSVLLPEVLCERTEPPDDRGEPSSIRDEAFSRVASKNAGGETEACRAVPGAESPAVQGPLDESRLSVRSYRVASTGAEGNGAEDGSEKSSRHPRASTCDGSHDRATTNIGRSGSPSERRQGRQPAGESGGNEQLHAQAGTQGNPPRTPRIEVRERALEVLASEVPVQWLRYFKPTGYAVRCGAAALLDAQSGELHGAGFAQGPQEKWSYECGKNCYGKGDIKAAGARIGDTGGASRFFYVSKASRDDREMGLDGLEIISIDAIHPDTGESLWESEGRKVKLRVDTEVSPPRVIVGCGVSGNTVSEWSMFLFGNGTTAPFLSASKSTIKTATKSITASRTLNWLTRLLTSGSTAAVNSATVSGGSRAGSVAKCKPSLIITVGQAVSLPGVGDVPAGKCLQITGNDGSPADHPTVKSTALMRWLVRLACPGGGTVLDCFMGSGSTGIAAILEGRRFLGIERDPQYYAIAEQRIRAAAEADRQSLFPLADAPPTPASPPDLFD